MTSSRSCSGSALAALLVLCLAGPLAGCGHARPPRTAGWRAELGASPVLVVFPVQNLSGGRAPVKALTQALRAQVEATGAVVVPTDEVDRVLSERRIRWTGGVDRVTATALREALGADGVLVSSVDAFGAAEPPRIALTARLVSTGSTPRILWMERVALAGNDAPGLLATGVVKELGALQDRAVAQLTGALRRDEAPPSCDGAARFAPRRSFRSPLLDDVQRRTVAVLPFVNYAARRDAGEVVALELLRQLRASGSFDVVEPGLVRRELLSKRLILDGGVSIDAAAAAIEDLGADLVLSGEILEYAENFGSGVPAVDFAVYLLDRRTRESVWSSTTRVVGDDGVWFFGLGRVTSAAALTCRSARALVERVAGDRPRGEPATAVAASAPEPRWRAWAKPPAR